MIFVPIIKPIGGDCNINCRYCYFRPKKLVGCGKGMMSDKILAELINQTCAVQDKVEFIWHGGEPLLAGIDFYKKVIELQIPWAKRDVKIHNSIQTNGILIDKTWIEFLKKNYFSVSVSVDGPKELHDKVRVDLNGEGTFDKVMRGIRFLQSANLLSGVICCVSKTNHAYPKEIFDFFIKQNIKEIKFLQVQGRDESGNLLPDSVKPIEFANFLLEVMQLWLELDDTSVIIIEIESVIKAMLGQEIRDCMFLGECHKYFTIYPNGDVYGCDSLPKIEQLCFGNISDGLEKIAHSRHFNCLKKRMSEIQSNCRDCRWFNICHGGCLQDYYPDFLNPETENLFCPGLKKIYKKIDQILREYGLLKAE